MDKTEKRKVKLPTHPPKKVTRAKVFSFKGDDGKRYTLTLQQKSFCEFFCQFSMKGVDAIIEAGYNVTNERGNINYRLASEMARENLLKPAISAYITTLLDKYGLNDDNVDKQLLAVVNQNAELGAKTKGIDIYYKKKGSYAPDKVEHGLNKELSDALNRIDRILPK